MDTTADTVALAVQAIRDTRDRTPPWRSALVALSGIDGSGKGYLAGRIAGDLEAAGLRVALFSIDGWLASPEARFNPYRPGEHFYRHAIRFPEAFEAFLTLRDQRRLDQEVDWARATGPARERRRLSYEDIDVILVEGIFLLKPGLRIHYDLSFWVDCTRETALERAVARRQEGLEARETVEAYRTIYFPAQLIHLRRDRPRESADLILPNDHRLKGTFSEGSGI